MFKHIGEQPGKRLARRRVAECKVLQSRHVVRAREQLADALLAVATGAADLLRVRLEALRQVVVDVPDVCLSIPIPKAIVATTIPSREPDHHSCTATRSS